MALPALSELPCRRKPSPPPEGAGELPAPSRRAPRVPDRLPESPRDAGGWLLAVEEEHQAIFQLLAELDRAASEQRTLFAVYTLARLKHYVRDHFAAEEAQMLATGFPRLAAHLAEHAAFRQRLAKFQVQSVVQDVSADMVAFLKEWLSNHIDRSDREYRRHLGIAEGER